jgi:DNA invertase Pin-like site-specific DNA recombinase
LRPRGEKHSRATLTDDQVRQTIDLLASGKARQEIADEFGVGRSVIDGIAKGQNWRHIPRPLGFDVRLPTSKLTEDQVREIRRLRTANRSIADLAKSFGVGRTTIFNIVVGRRWKWLAD